MKKIALAAALSLAATTAYAGGFADPIVEPEIIVQDTASSSAGIIIPILLLVLVAAAIAAD